MTGWTESRDWAVSDEAEAYLDQVRRNPPRRNEAPLAYLERLLTIMRGETPEPAAKDMREPGAEG